MDIDQYSKPIKIEKRKLTTLYYLNARITERTKGRELLVAFDKRYQLIKDFDITYSYYVRFLEKGNAAGNHYHKIRKELLIPIYGEFEIQLEDINTKEKESIIVSAKENIAIYAAPFISHKVISKNEEGVLLVLASAPGNNEDSIHYSVSA